MAACRARRNSPIRRSSASSGRTHSAPATGGPGRAAPDAGTHVARRHLRPSRRRLSPGIRPTRSGWCRTSRRCCTTTRSCWSCWHSRTRIGPTPLYAQRAAETVGWMMRDMTAERVDGGAAFAASEDADSEGEEGRFYVWTEAEVDALLGADARCVQARLRRDAGRQLGRPHDPAPRHAARLAGRGSRAGARPARCCSRRARSACGRGGTTRCWPTGTAWRSPHWRAPLRCSTSRTGWRAPGRRSISS